jgi:hypothetical protein
MASRTWKQYLNENVIKESLVKSFMDYDNTKVFVNTKDSGDSNSHVEKNIQNRSNLTVDKFKEKIKKVIKKVTKNYKGDGTYFVILRKSKIQILFKYTKKSDYDDMFIVTILDIDMTKKQYDHSFYINELFSALNIDLNNNQYVAYEESHHQFIEFMIENNVKTIDGINIIETEY